MDLSCNFIHLLHFTQGIVLFGLIHATVLQQLYVIVAARFVPLQSSCGHSVSLHCTEVALPPSFVGYESSSLGHHAAEKRDGSLYFIKSFHFFQVLSLKLFLFQFFALLRCKALDLVEMGGHFSVFVEHVDSCRISRLSRHDCDTSGT